MTGRPGKQCVAARWEGAKSVLRRAESELFAHNPLSSRHCSLSLVGKYGG
jgi:hypothetical protein